MAEPSIWIASTKTGLGTSFAKARKKVPADFDYDVVKFRSRGRRFATISGRCSHTDATGQRTVTLTAYFADDCTGFDVEASKQRSLQWLALPIEPRAAAFVVVTT